MLQVVFLCLFALLVRFVCLLVCYGIDWLFPVLVYCNNTKEPLNGKDTDWKMRLQVRTPIGAVRCAFTISTGKGPFPCSEFFL